MATNKILYVCQEISPYLPETEFSKLSLEMARQMQERGCEVRTFMPRYGCINERRNQLHEVIRLSGMNLIINDNDHQLIIKVASIPAARLQVYFIDNDDYFMKRLMAEDENGQEYTDNGERAIFFARGVLETVKKLRWVPDIIHCQGWMGAIVPLYIKMAYNNDPAFANCKVVTSLFSKELKHSVGENFKRSLAFREINDELLTPYKENFDFMELAKLAIDYSDAVIQAGDEANADLMAYAEQKNIPLLKKPEGDYTEAYSSLYEKIL